MKKLIIPIFAGAIMFTACESAPKADSAETSDAKEVEEVAGNGYAVNLDASTIEWVGTKPVGKHHGTVQITEGTLVVENGTITGGEYMIDLSTIQPDDQGEEGNQKLGGHLKSADFFDVENHPTGKFVITGVTEGVEQSDDLVMKDATHMITGNLTLKGETKSITFPAKVVMEDGKVLADANFNIDRTNWGLVYGNDKSLGDKFIRPEVNLDVHLEATNEM